MREREREREREICDLCCCLFSDELICVVVFFFFFLENEVCLYINSSKRLYQPEQKEELMVEHPASIL